MERQFGDVSKPPFLFPLQGLIHTGSNARRDATQTNGAWHHADGCCVTSRVAQHMQWDTIIN